MQPILLSTAYFPPISWMAAAVQTENIGLEIHETYPKQTYRNRCTISTSSGTLNLTVPVNRVNGNHTKTCDIQTDNSGNWQLLHWRSIVTAYNKSPYFLHYRDYIESVLFKKHKLLIDLNLELLNSLLKALQISNKEIFFTSKYEFKPDFQDLRNSFYPKQEKNRGIKVEMPRYIQAFEENHGFIPDLSILDLIFNLGPDANQYLANVKFSFQKQINATQDIPS
jgi:hypothetical protein